MSTLTWAYFLLKQTIKGVRICIFILLKICSSLLKSPLWSHYLMTIYLKHSLSLLPTVIRYKGSRLLSQKCTKSKHQGCSCKRITFWPALPSFFPHFQVSMPSFPPLVWKAQFQQPWTETLCYVCHSDDRRPSCVPEKEERGSLNISNTIFSQSETQS